MHKPHVVFWGELLLRMFWAAMGLMLIAAFIRWVLPLLIVLYLVLVVVSKVQPHRRRK